jgi:hypothetical protein
VREDADFHSFQMLEAALQQHVAIGNTVEGHLMLVAAACFLAAQHAPPNVNSTDSHHRLAFALRGGPLEIPREKTTCPAHVSGILSVGSSCWQDIRISRNNATAGKLVDWRCLSWCYADALSWQRLPDWDITLFSIGAHRNPLFHSALLLFFGYLSDQLHLTVLDAHPGAAALVTPGQIGFAFAWPAVISASISCNMGRTLDTRRHTR